MRVLIAPDCYGDSLTAVQAAHAIAQGWRQGRPSDELTLAPQSDGGPGFVGVLAGRIGEVRHTRVSGPLSESVDAEWVYDRQTATAYVECAQACGLALLGGPPSTETAIAAHSRGVGQLVAAALDAGAGRIVVGLGGSGCTDGGRGLIDALGGLTEAKAKLAGIELIAATDVEHPLLGPMGAARVFGPQKGADAATVEVLEQRMTVWAAELDQLAGTTVSPLPGAGAAGGLGAALLALGGRRESGAAVIA
jgi:glycerate kinase